jgi:hypothetical protein
MAKKRRVEVSTEPYIPPEVEYKIYIRRFTLLAPIPYKYKMPKLDFMIKHFKTLLKIEDKPKQNIIIEQPKLF